MNIFLGGISILLLIWAVVATFAALRRLPIPVPDLGSYIFPCGDEGIQEAIVSILKNVSGKKVFMEMDTDAVSRTIFIDGTIVNLSRPDVYEKMGKPAWAIALRPSKDPNAQAQTAMQILKNRNISFRYLGQFDPDVPASKMVGIQVANGTLGNAVIICRVHGKNMPRA